MTLQNKKSREIKEPFYKKPNFYTVSGFVISSGLFAYLCQNGYNELIELSKQNPELTLGGLEYPIFRYTMMGLGSLVAGVLGASGAEGIDCIINNRDYDKNIEW